jgi:serine/threonine-protein kinase RsbW
MPTAAPDLELTLPARAENVAVIRHVIGGVGEALSLDPEVLADVKLALSEACANAVIHAYAEDGAGLMDVSLDVEPGVLAFVVRDHGRGMSPRADSPGLGVGLPLIASLAESLELSNGQDGGTEVRMTFLREPAPDGAREDEDGSSSSRAGTG